MLSLSLCFDILALTIQICVHQEQNLDWFPRMRAMSLVSSDADGEQNEIRNLQEKLESTMKLVSNLSGQLTELKEQVGCKKVKEHVNTFIYRCGRQTLLRVCLFEADCNTYSMQKSMSHSSTRSL